MMWGFLRIFGLVGLPCLAIAACWIWGPIASEKRARPSVGRRAAATVTALVFCWILPFGSVVLPALAWRIWRRPVEAPKSLADRMAWTWFALGIGLMLSMYGLAATQEGDGDWRPRATIRLHTRIFLALASISLAGPLAAYLWKRREGRKRIDDPLEAPVGSPGEST
ncbi:hypothetical protein [Paludisphaera mucosa]|uniref:Uncharacterized protein n=1 Tax=Paludisphaera mucosa TaxID=3030827 RepID=A0ABT6FC73_9BACT|nr:hypothetical protein [Paludisphaera mucosa]MDG3005096.1 hypothetical protein [Paludisphaera mucosa]